MDNNNYFPSNLKYLREKRNLSKSELAKKLNVHQSTISRWENSEMGLTVDNAFDISMLFGIPLSDLLGTNLIKANSIDSKSYKKENITTLIDDSKTGYSVQLLSDEPFNALSKKEQEQLIEMAMDQLYEMKRELKK